MRQSDTPIAPPQVGWRIASPKGDHRRPPAFYHLRVEAGLLCFVGFPRGLLRRSRAVLSAKLVPKWSQDGPQEKPKIDLGASKNDIENEADLKTENERSGKSPGVPRKLFLGAKMRPKPVQDAFETALVLHPIFNALFLRSWLDFPSQLGSQKPPKSKKNRCKDAFPS